MNTAEKSQWFRSGFFSIFEKASVFVFGFGSAYLLTRLFTDVEFGIWVLFYTITSFIEVGRNGLLQNALVKYLSTAETKKEQGIITTASFLLNILVTFLCISFLLLLSDTFGKAYGEQLTPLLYIYCITTFLLVPQQQFTYIQQANFDFRGIFFSNFLLKGSFFFYVLLIYILGWEISLTKLATFQIFTAVAAATVSFFFVRPYLHLSAHFSKVWLKKLFNFGRFVFGTNLSTMLYKTVDKLMLGLISPLGAVAVAFYEWAIKITNLTEVPTFSVASVVFPQSARRMATEGSHAVKELYEKSVGAILALILPFVIAVFILAEPLIVLAATEEYLPTVPILRVSIWFGLFIPFAVQFGTVLDSMGKPKINFYFTIIGVFLNIVMNYIFITLFDAVGAAIGTLVSYSIQFIYTQIVLYKMIGVLPQNAFLQIIPFYKKGFKFIKEKIGQQTPKVNTEP